MAGLPLTPLDARIVFLTHPVTGAPEFARRLVERRLAACCNLTPVTSVYRWQGAVEEEEEVLCIVKTRRERLEALQDWLEEHHPYDVPELVALTPVHVAPPYLAWLLAEAGEGPPQEPGGSDR